MINGKFKNLYPEYSALHIEGALKAKPGKVIKIHDRNSGQRIQFCYKYPPISWLSVT